MEILFKGKNIYNGFFIGMPFPHNDHLVLHFEEKRMQKVTELGLFIYLFIKLFSVDGLGM